MKQKWIALVVMLVLLPCGLVVGGEIADLHRGPAEEGGPDRSRSHEQVDDAHHGITQIGLERVPWYGSGPVYTVFVQSDGTVRYNGQTNVTYVGERTGKVSPADFRRLAQFVRDSRYADFQTTYARHVTDQPTVYTTVITDGQRKVVKNYADAGPTSLWAIEQLIDKLVSEATWDKPSGRPTK